MTLNASVDEAIGLKAPQPVQVNHSAQTFADIKDAHREAIAAKDEHIAHLKHELEMEQVRIRRLTRFLRIFALENVLLVLVFILDVFSPTWGYFRHWISQFKTGSRMWG